ncbi:MAG: hypothetical protein N2Z20_01400 [Elusimicrobiales bacterium]|nr:hypothetical protein [Elusimicrobiales bacterium]
MYPKISNYVKKVLKVIFVAGFYLILVIKIIESETLQLTTYYPAPYGAYVSILTTQNSWLATTTGGVSIGTNNNPSEMLHVRGNSTYPLGRIISEGTWPGVWMWSTQTGNRSFVGTVSSNNDIGFWTSVSGWGFVMLQNGMVGIGTTAPIERLNVNGNIRIDNGNMINFCRAVPYPGGSCPAGTQIVGFWPSNGSIVNDFYATQAGTLDFTRYVFSTFSAGNYICCRVAFF